MSNDTLIAGLDVSLTTIGWALMSTQVDGSGIYLMDSGYFRFDKHRPDDYDNFDLMDLFMGNVWPRVQDADYVAIEDMMGFGRASGKLVQRGELVGMIKYEMYMGGREVVGYHPSTARKLALGRGTTPHHYEDAKEWVLDEVGSTYDFEWTRTRYDNIRSQHEDQADAIVVAAALRRQILQGDFSVGGGGAG
jgi:Holliday junction resolvasome RuvABC endonuclease subunit